jgi:hypothetical protein
MMLSIITDFGCRRNCGHCITRQIRFGHNGGRDFYHSSYWLDALFENLPNTGKFSISGGGDPLNDVELHSDFWSLINGICKIKGLSYDVHTSYWEVFDPELAAKHLKYMDRAVVHVNATYGEPIPWDKIRGRHRLVAVVDGSLTREFCEELEARAYDQVSYREYVALNAEQYVSDMGIYAAHPEYRADFDKWLWDVPFRLKGRGRFIKQGDYNTYLWPDGRIKTKFFEGELKFDCVEKTWKSVL